MPIDHLGLTVPPSSHKEVIDFYLTILKPLGYTKWGEYGPAVGLAVDCKPDFWITAVPDAPAKSDLHIAFATSERKVVDAFYAAAIEAGAKDNGAPGPRPHYHEHYYGGFVIDPLGNNVEAVCQTPA